MSSWPDRRAAARARAGRPVAARLLGPMALALACGLGMAGAVPSASAAPAGSATPGNAARVEPAATRFAGIGRTATPAELAAWDIDVRPDFKGLPSGAGTVQRGQAIWEAQCASCHGVFGESNEVFSPIAGGTTARDIETGRVARLTDPGFPQRTTLMKLPTVSTLWDYIARAMPWNAPKSLSTDEVYAVTAFVLHLGDIVPADFELSDRNIAAVQQRLPNRNGMTTAHAMWPGAAPGPGRARPDVWPRDCRSGCAEPPRIASSLPDHARDAHGQLAWQNRLIGPQVGADTLKPPLARPTRPELEPVAVAARAATAGPLADPDLATAGAALAARHQCITCHAADRRVLGPAFGEIGARHAGRADAVAYLAQRIREGGGGVWGAIPMPAQPGVSEAEAYALARWLLATPPR